MRYYVIIQPVVCLIKYICILNRIMTCMAVLYNCLLHDRLCRAYRFILYCTVHLYLYKSTVLYFNSPRIVLVNGDNEKFL